MKTATIDNVTQEEFDAAVQTLISGIKSSDPKLDTRIGTSLRSILINPDARILSTVDRQLEYSRISSSLKKLLESSENGEDIDVEDVNAILANFNIRSSTGTFSEGIAKITVLNGEQAYTIAEGTEIRTNDGLVFRASSTVTAVSPNSGMNISSNAILYEGASGYFFLVPVKASEVGALYNIPQGTSLIPSASIYTFVSSEAYKSFNGGSDIADLKEIIDKIPSGLAIRGFVNRRSCEGMLRDSFDSGDYPIVACSTVGYDNIAQRRDKHNVFGVGVGGRIDLYVRNFGDLVTVQRTITGRKVEVTEDGETQIEYVLDVLPSDVAGSCWVKSVSDVQTDVTSPLNFRCSRGAVGVKDTWHDIDVSKNPSEAFNTIWQSLSVSVMEVPPDQNGEYPDEREFNVDVYCLPQSLELQNYVDRKDVRSVSTDVVVRCPVICNVTVMATVVYDPDDPVDEESIRYKIRKYINGLGFVGTLTRSEIVHIIKSCGAVSVDLSKKDMLYGTLHDAYGKEYNLQGDALKIDGLAEAGAMLTRDTTIFAAEPENIQLILTPNR